MTEAGKFGLVIAQSFSGSVHPEQATNQTMMATHRRMAETNGPTAYVRHQRAIIARLDSRPGLEAIKVPTVVVVGEADQITPPDQAREMHDRIAGSRLVIVPRAGHMALLEQPEIVNAALVNWARQ
jgi:pimeloyl-ACP methyl ester carboxylesterase